MQETSSRPITFASEGLTLEGVLHQPSSAPFPAAAVCHPHPLFGGDMNNSVVVTVCQTLAEAGIAGLRFNYRGVGRSEGKYGDGLGERTDAAAALTHLHQLAELEQDRVGIVGYSFGATVALTAADERVAAVAAISTPSFGQSLPDPAIRCPTLFISGEQDEIAPAASLATLARTIGPQCQLAVVPGADHFWWGHEEELAELVTQFFRQCLVG
ncbi:MAG: alpha/beta fold hydrolase [Dehalococcoidia bacterium]|nr:MAG: alpha/beta fold hydrolase [Dehalococcoidia bacterium]